MDHPKVPLGDVRGFGLELDVDGFAVGEHFVDDVLTPVFGT
jgi:hypothetical protein